MLLFWRNIFRCLRIFSEEKETFKIAFTAKELFVVVM